MENHGVFIKISQKIILVAWDDFHQYNTGKDNPQKNATSRQEAIKKEKDIDTFTLVDIDKTNHIYAPKGVCP